MVEHSQVRHSLGLSFFQCITIQYLRFGCIISVMLVQACCILAPNCRWQCSVFLFKIFKKSGECQASLVCNLDCFVVETTLSFIFYF